jgi:hypothetical protein
MDGIVAGRIAQAVKQDLTSQCNPFSVAEVEKPESKSIASFFVIDLKRPEYASFERLGHPNPNPARICNQSRD